MDTITGLLPARTQAVRRASAGFTEFFSDPLCSRRLASPGACDFVFGNPQEMPLPGVVDAIREASIPQQPHWFAYKQSEAAPRQAVAASLLARLGLPVNPEDVLLTKGASAALAVVLQTVLGAGDEVIYVTPPWFFYEAMIIAAGGVPIAVSCDRTTFDLDVDAISAAVSPRTRAVIVNSPNNPTGRVYPKATLVRLAEALTDATRSNGRPVFLISDEAYQRIVFSGTTFVTPTAYYRHSFLLYSYGKTLLTPGQRLGYVALAPSMPDADEIRAALFLTQVAGGHGWPDATMQYALPKLERLCIDVERLQRRRDLLVAALTGQGYQLLPPEGTFYLLARSPIADDRAFAAVLADDDVFVLPGHVVDMPGYFRISLTTNDEMVDRSVDRFATAHARTTSRRANER